MLNHLHFLEWEANFHLLELVVREVFLVRGGCSGGFCIEYFPLYKTEDKLLIGRDKIPIGVIDKIIKKEELLPTSSESCLLISLAPRFPFEAYQTLNLFYFDNQYLFSVFQSNYNFHTHSCFDSQYILSLS